MHNLTMVCYLHHGKLPTAEDCTEGAHVERLLRGCELSAYITCVTGADELRAPAPLAALVQQLFSRKPFVGNWSQTATCRLSARRRPRSPSAPKSGDSPLPCRRRTACACCRRRRARSRCRRSRCPCRA